jgi:hypothetical protein
MPKIRSNLPDIYRKFFLNEEEEKKIVMNKKSNATKSTMDG